MHRKSGQNWLAVFVAGLASTSAIVQPNAQTVIRTDGTLGPAVDLGGGAVVIDQSLGQTAGANLFHSFDRFDIGAGDSATFTGADTLNHVIARVTGGDASDIDGTLRSTVANADLWLVNPAGIAFGESARVDVPASLHVSTASELRMTDGSVFSAADPQASTLSVAPPTSFGFLGGNGGITVDGSQLELNSGETLALVGGDVDIRGGQDGFLAVEGGRIVIAAAGPAGLVDLEAGVVGSEADISLTDTAVIDTSGNGGGGLLIDGGDVLFRDRSFATVNNTGARNAYGQAVLKARNLTMEDGAFTTDALSSGFGVSIVAEIEQDLVLRDQGRIASGTYDDGQAGNVLVQAGSITIDNDMPQPTLTGIASNTVFDLERGGSGAGPGGNVSVLAEEIAVLNGGQILSNSFGFGDAGTVTVAAGRLRIGGDFDGEVFTGISSGNDFGVAGDAGSVDISANEIVLEPGGTIGSGSRGSGLGGNVLVRADSLQVLGGEVESKSEAGGDGGNVFLEVGFLNVTDNGSISTSTFDQGDAGFVTIDAATVRVDGIGTDNGQTSISSNSLRDATGEAGGVIIDAGDVFVIRGGQISSSTFGQGDAGAVLIEATRVLTDQVAAEHSLTGIFGNANPGSTGAGGIVSIEAELLGAYRGSQISSSTFGEGDAGGLIVEADSVILDGLDLIEGVVGLFSSSSADATGSAGTITIDTNSLLLLRGGQVSSSTFSSGEAGGLFVNADSLTINTVDPEHRPSGIFSNAGTGSTGNAGFISVTGTEAQIYNAGQITSNSFGEGNAGTISLEFDRLTFNKSDAFSSLFTGATSSAEATSLGNAGQLLIDAGNLVVANGAQLQSSTFGSGDAGGVIVDADSVTVVGFDSSGVASAISSNSERGSTGDGGSVLITADALSLFNNGQVASGTFSSGSAGGVTVDVGTLFISRNQEVSGLTGLSSSAEAGSTGNAGNVFVTADLVDIRNGGQILSGTFSEGDAGRIDVQAGRIEIFGTENTDIFTGIGSNAQFGSGGNAGTVTIDADFVGIQDVANITSRTNGLGNAGTVDVVADEVVLLDGGEITSTTTTGGYAGQVRLTVGSLSIDGAGDTPQFTRVSSNALEGSTGSAGQVFVDAGDIFLINNGQIVSGTDGSGDAGQVLIVVDSLRIDPEGKITSLTTAAGDAGTISVDAGSIVIDGGGFTGIKTGIAGAAESDSGGNGGQVLISADTLEMRRGGEITSSTFGAGDAGDVRIDVESLKIDGEFFLRSDIVTEISSLSGVTGSGDAGRVFVNANDIELRGLGAINSSTASAGDAGLVQITAKTLRLPDNGLIASDSFGDGNAGDIEINARQVLADGSAIRTSGATTAGGRITVSAKEAIRISATEITTSGELPAEGASLLRLDAPFIEILNASRVLSLTGGPITPETGVRSGEASVDGVITVISDDSEIAASTNVVVQGLDAELGSELQLQAVSPVVVDSLLPASCAVQQADSASTLTSTISAGLGAQPDAPLATVQPRDQRAEACSGS